MHLFVSSGLAPAALATAVGLLGAALGVWLTGAHRRSRILVPFSAGVLLGVALFGLTPELALETGWTVTLVLIAVGYLSLHAINRYVYPVCPTCSHDHDHGHCATELHGFAWPLIAAAALHSFLDGWSVASAQSDASLGLRVAVPIAIGMHKLPEGIALGGILRVSLKGRAQSLGWCAIAEGATLFGGAAALWLAPLLGNQWVAYPVGITAGWLIFLGRHAIHEEWKRRGAAAAFGAAAAGVAGAAVILRGAEALFR